MHDLAAPIINKKFWTRKILSCNPIHSFFFFGSKQLEKKYQWEYITGAKLLETYSQKAFWSGRDGDNWSVISYECT